MYMEKKEDNNNSNNDDGGDNINSIHTLCLVLNNWQEVITNIISFRGNKI